MSGAIYGSKGFFALFFLGGAWLLHFFQDGVQVGYVYEKAVVIEFQAVSEVVNVIFQGVANIFVHRYNAVFVAFSLIYKKGFSVKINVFYR